MNHLAALALWVGLTLPAEARTADPGRSHASVQAPTLAPGIWGTVPLYGEVSPDGAFQFNAPAGSVTTGNPIYDAFLHRTLGRTITMIGRAPRPISIGPRVKLFDVTATVYVAGHAATAPLTVRTVQNANGMWLRSYARVGLAAYGIKSITGGPPGSLGIAINAYFPGH